MRVPFVLKRRLGRRSFFMLSGAMILGTGALGHGLGWYSGGSAWQQATGWARIAPELRPPADARGTSELPAGLELRWLGHSGFVVRWHRQTILLDPNTSAWCTISHRQLEAALDTKSLGTVDAALISHAHYDHMDLPTLKKALPRTLVVPDGSEVYVEELARHGVAVRGLEPYESIELGDLEIIAVPAAHNGSRFHPLRSAHLAVGYILRSGSESLYFAGDTGAGRHFEVIRDRYEPQVALLPIGAFEPSYPMQLYHLSPEQAVDAAQRLGVEVVVPCHFGTFRLSWDQPDEALPRFAAAAAAAQLPWLMPTLWRTDGRLARVAARVSDKGAPAGAAQ